MVAVASEWTRLDVIEHYRLPADKVRVVTLAPPMDAARPPTDHERADLRARFGLPASYALYPAQTWPHKNHGRLLEAVARLHRRGVPIKVVCTGRLTSDADGLRRLVEELGIAANVDFLGYVSNERLAELYGSATGVIFPSRFEGWGFPVVDALAAGVPVACADIPVLRELADGAAEFFDPMDIEAIARAMSRLLEDRERRQHLRAAGIARASRWTWHRTAQTFRALYRLIADRYLDDEDRALLAPPTLMR
jgi:glycosyltransferase involved in cell wall biosynthesis